MTPCYRIQKQLCVLNKLCQNTVYLKQPQFHAMLFIIIIIRSLYPCGNLPSPVVSLDYKQSPIFPQGQQSERNASVRQNHPTREQVTRGVSPFLAWGDFHMRSRFARSTIPEEKWGTTRSLWSPLSKKQQKPQSTPHCARLFPLPSGYHAEMMAGIAYSKKSGIHSQGSNFKVDSQDVMQVTQ